MRGHTRQQKRSHGRNGRVPRYMNENKFKHNSKSKKSERIMALVHTGLCFRCHDKIEWKKKYRKYKPLKRSAKCYICEQLKVTRAYHTICDDCGKERNCCVWCKLDFNKAGNKAKITREEQAQKIALEREKFDADIAQLSERDKRTMQRRRQRLEDEGQTDAESDNAATPEGTTAAACAAKASSQASAHIGKSLNSSSGGLTQDSSAMTKMERLRKLKEARARAKAQQQQQQQAPPSSLLDLAVKAGKA
eukprot:g4138.t1